MAIIKKKILVIGYFGYVNNQLDGQTVKTRDIRRLLEEKYAGSVDFYDTQEFQQSKLSIFKMFQKLCHCDVLIYLPGQNNLKYIFPQIFLLSRLFKFKIHYFVVGGWLNDFLDDKHKYQKMLGKISGIHVETKRLKNNLEKNYGYCNVDIFPNFRFFNFCKCFEKTYSKKLRLVFISRVCESKGLDTLKNLYESAKAHENDNLFTIDFYGQLTDEYYNANLQYIPIYSYKGILQPNEVISTISQYDAMIFPTHYEGEGCPGILIEAMFAGLPIIASDWKYNDEFIQNGVNGFLCNTYDVSDYENAILQLVNNPDYLIDLAVNSKEMSIHFSEEEAKRKLDHILEN